MKESTLLGSEFESSLRVLLLLDELEQKSLDEMQIACIDFIAIYGADFMILDENLHGNGLFRFSEFSAKSKLVTQSLKKLVLNGFISFTANKKGYSYSINAKGHEIANDLSDSYSEEYKIAVREVSTVFPSLNASAMQKQIYKITMNSLEAYNE
ncbi:ABC-three component system middle component 2 [Kandleria vitulina]|uniref:ABC-three component system middle component 2 n=1 Tax=Kandleria vitulina TaxID=1630 RepID=UPI000941FEEB|nr:ABC-three component system middle component 2 [Kandleria vitulina]